MEKAMKGDGAIKVLLVEDDEADAGLFERLLKVDDGVPVDLERVRRLSSAMDRLASEPPDVVVTDLGLPESSGIDTFLKLHAQYPDMPVIVLTGLNDEELAVETVKKGAQDYLVKGRLEHDTLLRSIRHSIERQKLLSQLEAGMKEIKTLKGLIPVCASCGKIRDDKDYWTRWEKYIEEHTDAAFTHGICPDCLKKDYPKLFEEIREEAPEVLSRQASPAAYRQQIPSTVRVLLIEDDANDVFLIRHMASRVKDLQIEIEHCDRLSSGIALLSEKRFDVVLTDLGLPDGKGLEPFIKTHALYPYIPVIILTGLADEELAVEAVRSGAQDYIVKDHADSVMLARAIRYSIERQRLLTDVESKMAEIRKLEGERKNILSMFAHDIRSALVPSIGFLTRLLRGKTRNLTVDLNTIRNELMVGERLLQDFIDFSRFESAEYLPAKSAFNIEEAIGQKITNMAAEAEQKRISIEGVFSEKPFPVIMADGSMINRVIANLLDNAVKYTKPEGTVTVKCENMEDDIVVKVQDTGIGIAPEDMTVIFDAFHRADNEQRGSGLGLAVARKIVEAHGGKIRVKSLPGKGSTFYFSLPKG